MSNAQLIAEAVQHHSEMIGLSTRGAEVLMELVAALEVAEARIKELETGWEYAAREASHFIAETYSSAEMARFWSEPDERIYRRRAPGPWLPVESEGE